MCYNNRMIHNKLIMNTQEVCAYLGFSAPTLTKRIAAGLITPLPKEYPNRYKEPFRFCRADVEKFNRAPAPVITRAEG